MEKQMKNSIVSDLSSHKYKKGLIQPPMNRIEGMQPTSWIDDRLPEYLWLGLVFLKFSRTEGIERVGKILKEISKVNKSIIKPKLSIILDLPDAEQEKIFKIISKIVNPKVLAPLTAIYRGEDYLLFNKYFHFNEFSFDKRVKALNKVIKTLYNHQSEEATDLRFLVLSLLIFQDKLRVSKDSGFPEAMSHYQYIDHDKEEMKMYRPMIRSMEMIDFDETPNKLFIEHFWKEIGLKNKCELIAINFPAKEQIVDYKKYIESFQNKVNQLIYGNKEVSIGNDKFDVIVGTATFSLKIFNDIIENDLDRSILGRHAYRTILEAYINIKYLIKSEANFPSIWQEYKMYGVGKLKLPLLKKRELYQESEEEHFNEPIVEMLVNEIVWEEFLDIDLRYFDNKKIKEKFEEVGEKFLYEVLYEYDNNYIHGFWSAVRESSMLTCNNPSHKYHATPDINFQQNLSPVSSDIYRIMEKFYQTLEEEF